MTRRDFEILCRACETRPEFLSLHRVLQEVTPVGFVVTALPGGALHAQGNGGESLYVFDPADPCVISFGDSRDEL